MGVEMILEEDYKANFAACVMAALDKSVLENLNGTSLAKDGLVKSFSLYSNKKQEFFQNFLVKKSFNGILINFDIPLKSETIEINKTSSDYESVLFKDFVNKKKLTQKELFKKRQGIVNRDVWSSKDAEGDNIAFDLNYSILIKKNGKVFSNTDYEEIKSSAPEIFDELVNFNEKLFGVYRNIKDSIPVVKSGYKFFDSFTFKFNEVFESESDSACFWIHQAKNNNPDKGYTISLLLKALIGHNNLKEKAQVLKNVVDSPASFNFEADKVCTLIMNTATPELLKELNNLDGELLNRISFNKIDLPFTEFKGDNLDIYMEHKFIRFAPYEGSGFPASKLSAPALSLVLSNAQLSVKDSVFTKVAPYFMTILKEIESYEMLPLKINSVESLNRIVSIGFDCLENKENVKKEDLAVLLSGVLGDCVNLAMDMSSVSFSAMFPTAMKGVSENKALISESFSRELTLLQKKIIDRNFDTHSKDDKIEDDVTGLKI